MMVDHYLGEYFETTEASELFEISIDENRRLQYISLAPNPYNRLHKTIWCFTSWAAIFFLSTPWKGVPIT
jgi:hypothetical protein